MNFKEAETQRPDFKGTFKRNLANNQLNKLTYSNFKKEMKVILGIGVSFFMICCSIAISLGIMFLKNKLVEEKHSAFLVNVVPPLLNFIAAKIFSITYEIVSRKLNDYENHRSITEFENSMINKIFLFNLFNTFNSFIIIAFLKEDTDFFGTCPDTPSKFSVTSSFGVNRSCYNELISYTTTYYIVGFALGFLEILLPAILGIIFKKNYPIKRTYEWGNIDMLVEKEWDRAPYQITSEIDGVLKEYLKIALLVTAVSMFGTAFPLGFVLAYFTMSSSIKIDKFKLLNYMRRPVPKGASDIGFWSNILEIVNNLSIVANISILAFTSSSIDTVVHTIFGYTLEQKKTQEYQSTKYLIYTVFLLLMFLIKKIIQIQVSDVPRETKQILQRHHHLLRKMGTARGGTKPLMRTAPLLSKFDAVDLDFVINPESIMKDYEDG